MEVFAVPTVPEIIMRMRAVAPEGRQCLSHPESRKLADLTQALLAAKPDAPREYSRFLAIGQRSIGLPRAGLEASLSGKSVLVTGGTGCIGSALLAQLVGLRPRRLVSVSRGYAGGPRLDGAEYVRADVRDLARLTAVFGDIRPDVVFHVAAQRDPGLAEHEVHRTVTTNVLGTRNVIAAAAGSGAAQVVCASTGKALRPYSPDVYTASKRVAEWLLSRAAARGAAGYSAVRFTHVVDNSIIHARLLEWCAGGVIRLHSPDAAFYAQSALESAQLLLGASTGGGGGAGALRLHAITDLGWPVSLLDMALGVLKRTGSGAPIYLSGYDHGYEAVPFPGLYDPETAGAVSPLLNAFEAARAGCSPCPGADAFPLEVAPVPGLAERMQALDDVCARTQQPGPVRAALDELSWSLLDATLTAVPGQALVRAARLAAPHRDSLNAEHRRLLAVIEHHAAVGESSLV
jgi:nucleoside-diphosphate-sugar epimerase